jgi:hypothetical protein
MKINKKIFLIIISFLLVLAIAIVFLLKSPQKSSVKDAVSLTEAMEEINYNYKLLNFPFPELRQESVAFKISRANEAWAIFVNNFQSIQPPEFGRTREWQKKLLAIKEYSTKADELVREKSESAALVEMEKAYAIYSQIKKENNINDMWSETSSFYKISRKVSLVEKNEVSAAGLTDLKLIFTGIKERLIDDQQEPLIIKLEQAILDIERLLPGPDFKKAQSDLMTSAEEMYWKY